MTTRTLNTETVTTEIEATVTAETPSRWQRLLAWIAAFEEAMNHDPQQESAASIRRLGAEIERLNARLDEAEDRYRAVA